MKAALQNVAIYLGYVARSTRGEPLSSVSLDCIIEQVINGVPEPVPIEDREDYQQRFRRWAIGQALTEIDQSYQRFVVSALEVRADLISFRDHGRLARHRPNLANSWAVHEQLFEEAPAREPDRLRDAEWAHARRHRELLGNGPWRDPILLSASGYAGRCRNAPLCRRAHRGTKQVASGSVLLDDGDNSMTATAH
jgi:hypothetical protein